MTRKTIILFYLFKLLFLTDSFSQQSIYAIYENLELIKGMPLLSESRPCYLAEINVENCKMKKIMELDSINIRSVKDLVLDNKSNKMFLLHNHGNHAASLSNLDLTNKKVESSIILSKEIPWNVTNVIPNQVNQFLQFYKDNGVLLLARRDTIFEFNYYTKSWKKVWKAGSMYINIALHGFNTIWYKGSFLYYTQSKPVSKIHLSQDGLVTTYSDTTGISIAIGGALSNNSTACDTSIIYSINNYYKTLYTIDLEKQTSKKICSNPLFEHVKAITSPNDYLSANCSPLIDLDFNDSSDTTRNNYKSGIICEANKPIPVSDTDLIVNTGNLIDSLVCFIKSGVKDGNNEKLIFQGNANPKITQKGNGTQRITFYNKNLAKSLDFRTELNKIFYQNNKILFTGGDRIIAFQLFASGEKSDTALATLYLRRNEAGQDTVIRNCENKSLLLTDYLKNANSKFGEWYPALSSGTSLYNPNKDKSNQYIYAVSNGFCKEDSALISIKKGIIATLKNIDTTLCFGNILQINNKKYEKQGFFKDTLKNNIGCDSIVYNIKINVRPEAKSSVDTVILEGENFTINNQIFNSKGDFSIKIKNKHGCDSLITLKIDVKSKEILIPNIFTPESNDENQFFRLVETSYVKKIAKMYIFNRWGQLVFKCENSKINDTKARWDGSFQNKPQASDVYIYYLELETINGLKKMNGEVTLLR